VALAATTAARILAPPPLIAVAVAVVRQTSAKAALDLAIQPARLVARQATDRGVVAAALVPLVALAVLAQQA
jgi:hypothetical protein